MHAKHDLIDQIEKRIATLQQSCIASEEQLKITQNNMDKHIHESALRIIDILDMIDTIQSNNPLSTDETKTIERLTFKKIEKRLLDILRHWQVHEISITEGGQLDAATIRVLETREASDATSAGKVIEVCRKGYQRANKTIRPVDVVTAV